MKMAEVAGKRRADADHFEGKRRFLARRASSVFQMLCGLCRPIAFHSQAEQIVTRPLGS